MQAAPVAAEAAAMIPRVILDMLGGWRCYTCRSKLCMWAPLWVKVEILRLGGAGVDDI